MAIYEPSNLAKPIVGGVYTSDKRLALTADGRICDDTDPEADTLLVGEGGTIPADEARSLGLITKRAGRDDDDESPMARRQRSVVNRPASAESNGEDEEDEEDTEDEENEDEEDEDEETPPPPTSSGLTVNTTPTRQRATRAQRRAR